MRLTSNPLPTMTRWMMTLGFDRTKKLFRDSALQGVGAICALCFIGIAGGIVLPVRCAIAIESFSFLSCIGLGALTIGRIWKSGSDSASLWRN